MSDAFVPIPPAKAKKLALVYETVRQGRVLVAAIRAPNGELYSQQDLIDAVLDGKPRTVKNLRPHAQLFNVTRALAREFHESRDEECSAMIYFIEGETTGLIKIGQTTNVLQRMRELQLGSPDTLLLRYFYRAPPSHENRLHRVFKASRVHGEWFKPTPDLISYVDRRDPGRYQARCAA